MQGSPLGSYFIQVQFFLFQELFQDYAVEIFDKTLLSVWFLWIASCRGVQPSIETVLGSAPRGNKYFTTSRYPKKTAKWRAFHPACPISLTTFAASEDCSSSVSPNDLTISLIFSIEFALTSWYCNTEKLRYLQKFFDSVLELPPLFSLDVLYGRVLINRGQ
jgi:hypothetical protein